jgi:beta-glucosidase
MKKFSSDFMLGAATAAHQVEGNNTHSDFWALEGIPNGMFKEPSLDAVDHYNRYEEDITLMKNAGLNAYRFSIEWARIEPAQGEWDEKEIEHYRRKIAFCRKNGIEPIITMHHFSTPKWVVQKGGWSNAETADFFATYCEKAVKELGAEMKYVCTINEANMVLQILRLMKDMQGQTGDIQVGISPEQRMERMMAFGKEAMQKHGINPRHIFLSPGGGIVGNSISVQAHMKARDAMKAACPHLKVGITLSLHDFQPQPGGEYEAEIEWIEEFTQYLPFIYQDDFIGVQNYTRKIIGSEGSIKPSADTPVTQMGYENYPASIGNVAAKVSKMFKGEIIITENGIATDDDNARAEFIRKALEGVQAAIADGTPIKGYMYWSLLDNFEWMLGFDRTFGLIAVDRKTQTRHPKESLKVLGSMVEGKVAKI